MDTGDSSLESVWNMVYMYSNSTRHIYNEVNVIVQCFCAMLSCVWFGSSQIQWCVSFSALISPSADACATHHCTGSDISILAGVCVRTLRCLIVCWWSISPIMPSWCLQRLEVKDAFSLFCSAGVEERAPPIDMLNWCSHIYRNFPPFELPWVFPQWYHVFLVMVLLWLFST